MCGEVKWSGSVMSDSLPLHGLQPTRLLHPWDFPGKSTGVGCHCLLRHCLNVYSIEGCFFSLLPSLPLSLSPPAHCPLFFSLSPLLSLSLWRMLGRQNEKITVLRSFFYIKAEQSLCGSVPKIPPRCNKFLFQKETARDKQRFKHWKQKIQNVSAKNHREMTKSFLLLDPKDKNSFLSQKIPWGAFGRAGCVGSLFVIKFNLIS